jgi:plasmid stabilization system protein ParE
MAVKPLEIHPEALAELKSAVAWYLDRNEAAADNFATEMDRAIDLIAASPQRWPRGLHRTRKFVLQRFPFAIVYREKETFVQVLAIAHGHRRPGYWKDHRL